jgi:flagellar biosynthetic protein FliP
VTARRILLALVIALGGIATVLAIAAPSGAQVQSPDAQAQAFPAVPDVQAPALPSPAVNDTGGGAAGDNPNRAQISINLPDLNGDGKPNDGPGQSVLVILLLTVLAVAPALLIMLTSFTRIVIVLSLTRNALGLQSIPPNQVVIGLSLFLSIFVMFPTLKAVNEQALQPLLDDKMSYSEAYDAATVPVKHFMLDQTRSDELTMFVKASHEEAPKTREDVSMATLVPAFVLSELKTAFIIGFVIFVPFLVIDLVVGSALMSMGMFMLPPVLVSLPFKLLLFVMVDGWSLVTISLIKSFH